MVMAHLHIALSSVIKIISLLRLSNYEKIDGSYYVVEAVPDTAIKLWIVSAYMSNNNSGDVTQVQCRCSNPEWYARSVSCFSISA